MGRVKVAPTPRNLALDEIMRRAAASITSTTTLRPADLPRSLPPPLPLPRPPVRPARSSVPVSRTSKESTKERSSVDSQKRKSAPTDDSAPPAKKAATAKLSLRSATKSSTTANGEVSAKDTSGDNTTQATVAVEPTRRSTRSSKANTSIDKKASTEPAAQVPVKSPRSTRAQKKTAKPKSSTAEVEERQKAIAMLQGEDFLVEDGVTETVNSPAPARSSRGSTRAKTSRGSRSAATSRRGSAPSIATQPDDVKSEKQYDVLPPASAGQSPAPIDQVGTPARASSVNLAADATESKQDLNIFDLDVAAGLPYPTANTPAAFSQDQMPTSYVYPDPVNQTPAFPVNGVTNEQNVKTDHGAVDGSSATSGDSGYVTSQSAPQPMYLNGPIGMNGQLMPLAPATPDTRNHAFQFVLSTKGQKVKGRPTPRNPKPQPREVTPRSGRNIANTYPRKQPFKAQIEFPGYPPAGSDVPPDYSLWEICQNYPNNLREGVLLGFVQREWSANELCACLRDDAREILNSRPGKDKTMVFQKRMERIKKDLVAKREYENLIRGPMIREDGRPTWVKRGNVRRK